MTTSKHEIASPKLVYSQDYHFKYISVGWWQTFYSHKLGSIRLSTYVCISSASTAEQKILACSHEQRARNLNSLSVYDEFLYCVQDHQPHRDVNSWIFFSILHIWHIYLAFSSPGSGTTQWWDMVFWIPKIMSSFFSFLNTLFTLTGDFVSVYS